MPNLKRKSHQKEFHGDDKPYHYGNHKIYDRSSRAGYKKKNNDSDGVRAGRTGLNLY